MLPILAAYVLIERPFDVEQVALNSVYQYIRDQNNAASIQERRLIEEAQANGKAALPGLLRLTFAPRWKTRCGALIALVEAFPNSISNELILRTLNDPEGGWAGALAAGKLGRKELLPDLYRVATRDAGTLCYATWAIGKIDPAGCGPYMKKVLGQSLAEWRRVPRSGGSGPIVSFAAAALANLGDEGRTTLLSLIESERSDVRAEVCQALGRFDNPDVHAALTDRLKDENFGVRAQAQTSLCRIHDETYTQRIRRNENTASLGLSPIDARYVEEVGIDLFRRSYRGFDVDTRYFGSCCGGEHGYDLYRSAHFGNDVLASQTVVFGIASAAEVEKSLSGSFSDVSEVLYGLVKWNQVELDVLRRRADEFPRLAALSLSPDFETVRGSVRDLQWALSRKPSTTPIADLCEKELNFRFAPYPVRALWQDLPDDRTLPGTGKRTPEILSWTLFKPRLPVYPPKSGSRAS